jgi:hypothetical protein
MSAPERIWAGKHHGTWWQSSPHHQMTEYRRADLPPTLSEALAVPEVRALVEAARPFVSPMQNADYARQLRQYEALCAALRAIEERHE